ncbi:tail fiber domain-containing protein [Shewanella maritima]|uniref:tail fiber domain-containing protein n=1 Tax=Shewanella maritima TaxID=2520507 RepID=UPI0037368FBF
MALSLFGAFFAAHADQQILDDLIVTQSACIGQDCVNGESFGFDTLRLKENNLRIKFQDTSNSASFPSNDWQLTANDSTNGGLNKFSIDDIDGGRTPFTIEAGAQNHALYVDDGGRVGLGTSTPVVELQVVDGDSPTLRLEQDGSSGFTAQTWDLAGNETNFFVRDVTNGSKLPFKIMPSAPTNALVVSSSGNIGIGDQTPDAKLDIENGDLLVSHNSATNIMPVARFEMNQTNNPHVKVLELENLGGSSIIGMKINNVQEGLPNEWKQQARYEDSTFRIVNSTNPYEEFVLSPNGDLTILGTITATGTDFASSRSLKENFTQVDNNLILEKLVSLPISKWNYIKQSNNTKHIGPMAEDFHKAFGLNGDKKGKISVSDIAGVSLAAIQALKLELDKSKAEIKMLKELIQEK